MNKYEEALDVICRYVSDQRHGIVRYAEREICECLGTLGEMEKQFAQYQKALDKACHVIGELNDCTNIGTDAYRKCPFLDECNKGRFNECIASIEKWKEWLLND